MKRRAQALTAKLLLAALLGSTGVFGVAAPAAQASGSTEWTSGGVQIAPSTATDYRSGTQGSGLIATASDGGYVTAWKDSTENAFFAQKYNSSGVAQWTSAGVEFATDNTTSTISTLYGVISDGAGGVDLLYNRYNSSDSSYELYVQRIASNGAMLWGSGVCIECTADMDDPVASAISDGSGGMIVGYPVGSTGSLNVFVQRVDSSGTLQWGSGTQLTTASGNQRYPVVVTDGAGGAIIGFQDEGGSSFDQRAQRVNSSGVAQWTAGGVAVVTATGSQTLLTATPHSSGGAVFAWQDARTAQGVYVQRLNSSGTAQWTANGVRIYNTFSSSLKSYLAGSGTDTMVLYRSASNSNDVILQKVASNGAAIFSGGGIGVLATANQEQPLGLVASGDGSGDVIAAYIDYTNYELRINKLQNDGTKLWGASGVLITTSTGMTSATTYAIDTNASGDAVTSFLASFGEDDVFFQRSAASDGSRQWGAGGVRAGGIGGQATQGNPHVDADSSGNTYVAWKDFRTFANLYDVYAQKIDADGNALWTATGVAVDTDTSSQNVKGVLEDGSGGMYVYWYDDFDVRFYLQRLNSSGAVASGWPAGGLAISSAGTVSDFDTTNMVADGSGGVIITYLDSGRVYASRVNASGTKLWGTNGTEISSTAGTPNHSSPVAYPDGAGGAVFTWSHLNDDVPGDYQVRAIKLTSAGAVASGWTTGGTLVSDEDTIEFPRVTMAGTDVFVAWQEIPGANLDIKAQKLNASGSVQWTAGGVTVCNAAGHQEIEEIVPSDTGVIVVWQDPRNGNDDIYAQRMTTSGSAAWTANGLPVTDAAGAQSFSGSANVIPDGGNGVIVVWEDSRAGGDTDIYGERLDSTGASKWATDGLAIVTRSSLLAETTPAVTSNGSLGAFVYYAAEGSPENIFGQSVLDSEGAVVNTFTGLRDTMTRLKIGVSSYHTFQFIFQDSVTGTLTILMPAGFTSLAASGSMTGACDGGGSIAGFAASATSSFTANLTACKGNVIINASSTASTGFNATNPGSPGAYTIRLYAGGTGHTSQSAAAAAATMSANLAVYITNEDQVTVTGAVDASITFEVGATHESCNATNAISGGTVNLGVIPTSGSYRASKATTTFLSGLSGTVNHICARVVTNATNGYSVTVKSANGALTSTSAPADKIPAAAQAGPAYAVTMAAGTPSYGLCVGSASNEIGVGTSTPAGASATGTAPFNFECTNSLTAAEKVGALTTDTNTVYSAAGPVQNGWATLYVKAAAGPMTEAHTDYADTLTFIATATF